MSLNRVQKIGLGFVGTVLSAEMAVAAFWTGNEIANDPIDCPPQTTGSGCVFAAEQQRSNDQLPELALGSTALICAMGCALASVGVYREKYQQQTPANLPSEFMLLDAAHPLVLTAMEEAAFEQIVHNNTDLKWLTLSVEFATY